MANPRRTSISVTDHQSPPCHVTTTNAAAATLSSIKPFLKKPQALPILLSLLLLITWISLRLQSPSSPNFSSPPHRKTNSGTRYGGDGDLMKRNVVRFLSGYPSPIAKDKRGWLLDPVAVALDAGVDGGAVNCASLHVGEISAGNMRGNHRHHSCNETFLIWGAKTVFRLEMNTVNRGYAEVTIQTDEVAVITSPRGTAHALINIDSVRSTFIIGCQDSIIRYNNSTSDYNIWKDL